MDAPVKRCIEKRLAGKYPSAGDLHFSAIGGGCINETYRISFNGEIFFCKINSATKFPHLFEAESDSLQLLAASTSIRIPSLIDYFIEGDHQVLLLEWIKEGERTETFWKQLGKQLAALHTCSNDVFGWTKDNFMGSISQCNKTHDNWIEFFVNERLEPLLLQALNKGLVDSTVTGKFNKLYNRLNSIFPITRPSLVHGDLWSGNLMCDQNSQPVLIDPAAYFGHPAVDLGMTTLFGGFRPGFYETYQYYSPLPSNYEEQWRVANLYPLLIHLLLFGKSYLLQIETTLQHFA